jgi:hypothetical protein
VYHHGLTQAEAGKHLDVRVAHGGIVIAYKLKLAERQVVHLKKVRRSE